MLPIPIKANTKGTKEWKIYDDIGSS
jgi:hypothetical protein